MTHTDETALLAAIRDRPGDDLPRLVYADWLEERDQSDPARRIRDWVYRLKPAAVAAWEAGRVPPGVDTVADTLQAADPHTWRLAAVLGQRLSEARWPVPYDRVTGWPAGWDAARHRAAILDCRHAAELAGYGLGVDPKAAESAQLAARSAAWSAQLAAGSAAESAWGRLYASVLAGVREGSHVRA